MQKQKLVSYGIFLVSILSSVYFAGFAIWNLFHPEYMTWIIGESGQIDPVQTSLIWTSSINSMLLLLFSISFYPRISQVWFRYVSTTRILLFCIGLTFSILSVITYLALFPIHENLQIESLSISGSIYYTDVFVINNSYMIPASEAWLIFFLISGGLFFLLRRRASFPKASIETLLLLFSVMLLYEYLIAYYTCGNYPTCLFGRAGSGSYWNLYVTVWSAVPRWITNQLVFEISLFGTSIVLSFRTLFWRLKF